MKKEAKGQIVKAINNHMKDRINLSFFALKNVRSRKRLQNADISGIMKNMLWIIFNMASSFLFVVYVLFIEVLKVQFRPDAMD